MTVVPDKVSQPIERGSVVMLYDCGFSDDGIHIAVEEIRHYCREYAGHDQVLIVFANRGGDVTVAGPEQMRDVLIRMGRAELEALVALDQS